MGNAWVLLVIAGLFEVVWAAALKASNGFTVILPSAITAIAAAISFWLLALAMKDLPLGTAYAVWVGIGVVGAAVLGVAMFGDQLTPMRVAGIALIIAGITALKIA